MMSTASILAIQIMANIIGLSVLAVVLVNLFEGY